MNAVARHCSQTTSRIVQHLGLAAFLTANSLGAAISHAAEPPQDAQAAITAPTPFEVVPEKGIVTLGVRRSLVLRAKSDIHRTAVVDRGICEIVQTTPREITLVGRAAGQTQVTFWFSDATMTPLTYVVEVKP
jgi:pilus assembly protein CpaC